MPERNEQKAPACNPELKKSIAVLRGENSPKNLNAVINELVKSPLLTPALFDLQGAPAPKPGPDGRVQLPKNAKISMVMLNTKDGKHYYLAFSDWDAVHEWQKTAAAQGRQIMMLRFDDFANMLQKNKEVSGIILNPGENSLRLEAPLIESVKKQKDTMAQMLKAQEEAKIHPGDKVTIVEPTILPDGLVDPICNVLAQAPGVGSAYLQIMIVNETRKCYLLVLDGPKDEKLFAAVAQAARPYLAGREQKMDLTITTSISPLGQQGMRGSEPFYRKGIGRVVEEDDDE
ncbi:enhanced serine sensitivity protein SseB C-terminal domain-containing protein [uncultured Subdoligranulum sp.]|uniref:enhanced serine sensitivity protein SseB C-terminal domain-containing protein n=1 Tax=uncultured Subdoligranulum sp. TaxID=512298 RepID=UPI00262B7864|nr:enhanced serine sensitivity protein SseB C-terminal domain-containing protein [uncultured Subdoligranulum sp.]